MIEVKRDFSNESKLTRYSKKHPAETASCFRNLGRLLAAVDEGLSLQQCSFGFFRSEGHDVYRIAQTGIANAHETRLYIYVKITKNDVQLLTIGDKDSQASDIEWCHSIARKIQGANTDEKKQQQ